MIRPRMMRVPGHSRDYAVVAVALAVATGARAAFTPLWGFDYAFATYYPVVMFAAWVAGWRAGVGATVVSALLSVAFFLPHPLSVMHTSALGFFVLGNVFVTLTSEALHHARGKAEADAVQGRVREDRLEREIVAHREIEAALHAAEVEREEARATAERARSEAETATRGLRRVQQISDVAVGDLLLKLDDLLHAMLTRVQTVLEADTAAMLLRTLPEEEGEGEQLVVRAALGLDGDADAHPRVRIGTGFAGRIAQDRCPQLLSPVDETRLVSPLRGQGLRSLAGVPLVAEGRLLGVLHVGSRQEGKFSQEDIGVLQLAADRLAVAMLRTASRDELMRARDAAEAANRAKDTFLATVSHELRSPLSPILTWSRMLREGILDAGKTARALETIERSAKSQAQLIEDLLDVSRIVAGRMRLEVRPIDLVPMIQAAVDVVRPAADAKALRLHVGLDRKVGTISGDAERLQQVVWNLLSNAVKFTPEGGRVSVVLARVNYHAEIAVSDSGKGISPDFLPHVFERFKQEDSGPSRSHGGLGLGLAIARHIVELHGGTIHAESPGDGRGAVFTVKLPLIQIERMADEVTQRHPTTGGAPESVPYPTLRHVRALVVDDDPDSNESVRVLLGSCGAEVRVAGSAAQAREVLSEWTPHVLVSDIGMPGEDGYEFIASLRAQENELPAVAFTAYATTEDRVRLLGAGFQAHVAKPLDPAELIAIIASLATNVVKL
jgi:signal transduction histidine kinase